MHVLSPEVCPKGLLAFRHSKRAQFGRGRRRRRFRNMHLGHAYLSCRRSFFATADVFKRAPACWRWGEDARNGLEKWRPGVGHFRRRPSKTSARSSGARAERPNRSILRAHQQYAASRRTLAAWPCRWALWRGIQKPCSCRARTGCVHTCTCIIELHTHIHNTHTHTHTRTYTHAHSLSHTHSHTHHTHNLTCLQQAQASQVCCARLLRI
jgi:hypothetical protein